LHAEALAVGITLMLTAVVDGLAVLHLIAAAALPTDSAAEATDQVPASCCQIAPTVEPGKASAANWQLQQLHPGLFFFGIVMVRNLLRRRLVVR
jgi:hypothetical protein